MNSNYEWQKHQADERAQARLRDAKIHRQLKEVKQRPPFILPLELATVAGVVMFVIWLLAG